MPKTTEKPVVFRLVKSSIDQFAVFEKNNTDSDVEFDFESSVTFKYDTLSRIFTCTASVECNKLGKLVATAALTYGFEIAPESAERLIIDDKAVLPQEILAYFCSKTYGGLRGVLVAKLEPTSLRITLPLINLSEIVTQPLEVPLN